MENVDNPLGNDAVRNIIKKTNNPNPIVVVIGVLIVIIIMVVLTMCTYTHPICGRWMLYRDYDAQNKDNGYIPPYFLQNEKDVYIKRSMFGNNISVITDEFNTCCKGCQGFEDEGEREKFDKIQKEHNIDHNQSHSVLFTGKIYDGVIKLKSKHLTFDMLIVDPDNMRIYDQNGVQVAHLEKIK